MAVKSSTLVRDTAALILAALFGIAAGYAGVVALYVAIAVIFLSGAWFVWYERATNMPSRGGWITIAGACIILLGRFIPPGWPSFLSLLVPMTSLIGLGGVLIHVHDWRRSVQAGTFRPLPKKQNSSAALWRWMGQPEPPSGG